MTPESPPPIDGPDPTLGPHGMSGAPEGWADAASGLPGPVFWRTILAAESARSARYRRPATVVLAELVGLDRLAERWGDDVARQAVVTVARVLRAGGRTSDYVARLDAARFGMILTETDEVAAINYVERARERCERELRAAAEGVRVAFGWASPSGSSTLMAAADQAETRLRAERAD